MNNQIGKNLKIWNTAQVSLFRKLKKHGELDVAEVAAAIAPFKKLSELQLKEFLEEALATLNKVQQKEVD